MNKPIATLLQNIDQEYLSSVSCVTQATEESKELLDQEFPLKRGSHKDADSYSMYYQNLVVHLNDGTATGLEHPAELIEACGRKAEPEAIVLENEHLHAEIEFDCHGKTRAIALEERDS